LFGAQTKVSLCLFHNSIKYPEKESKLKVEINFFCSRLLLCCCSKQKAQLD